MKNYVIVPILCLASATALATEPLSKCAHKVDVGTVFQGVIEASKDYDRKTFPYVDNTRKCVIKLQAKIKDVWHPTSGEYIFGPDLSENQACKLAETKAKESLLRQTVPEKLRGVMTQKCTAGSNDVAKVKPPVKIEPKVSHTVVQPVKPKAVPVPPVAAVPLPKPRIGRVPTHTVYNHYGFDQYGNHKTLTPASHRKGPRCHKNYFTVWINGQQVQAFAEECR
tara:strand:- start:95 stop:766 length:672 start_codon:yes stop_codon:yes gene_type:complete